MDRMKKNHGTTVESAGGMKIMTGYGQDQSDVTGSASKERIGKFGGSTENLSHTLSGASANQKGT